MLLVCGSINHMEVKCLKMILIQDSSSTIGCYITRNYHIFLKAHANSKCSSLDTNFQRRDILVITKPWSSYPEIFGGHKCRNPSKNMSQHMTYVSRQKSLDIVRMSYYTYSRFQRSHGLSSLWTSLWTFRYPTTLIQLLWWLTILQRWPLYFMQQDSYQQKDYKALHQQYI